MIQPVVRILLRYGAGIVFGMEVGDMLAGDPDVVMAGAALIGVLTEWWYSRARKTGGAT